MKKKKTLAKLKKELWVLFSLFIRRRDGGKCFTCERSGLDGSSYHAGHFIKASVGGLHLYFNENNVHGQCAYCNLFLDGNQYEYGIRLGPKIVKELYALKALPKPVWSRDDYAKKIAFYKELLACG